MTEEQKRFKIKKRTSYEEQVSQENLKAGTETFVCGITAIGAVGAFYMGFNPNEGTTPDYFASCIGMANIGFSVYSLKFLMESICRKVMLEGKIEDINTELEMPEDGESRTLKR